MSEAMTEDLRQSEVVVRREAVAKYGESEGKRGAVADHVYKYKRAHYFRNRSPRANRPPYSGFETLVYLSTGVVRNLLEPCFWMFDRTMSELGETGDGCGAMAYIASDVQTEVIIERSKRLWAWLEEGISEDVDGCSSEDGRRAYQFLDALAVHFRYRLLQHRSEPCALSFTISRQDASEMGMLKRLLDILRKAQLLYVRSGPAKDQGQREVYYLPNRMLWPVRGLDPHGQHARVSLPARVLWSAAETGRIEVGKVADGQKGLWDDDEE